MCSCRNSRFYYFIFFKIPKDKSSLSSRLRNYEHEFGENIFSTDGQIILCKLCGVKVSRYKRYTITQNIKTEKRNFQSLFTNTTTLKYEMKFIFCTFMRSTGFGKLFFMDIFFYFSSIFFKILVYNILMHI
jgi:hypothetical protein